MIMSLIIIEVNFRPSKLFSNSICSYLQCEQPPNDVSFVINYSFNVSLTQSNYTFRTCPESLIYHMFLLNSTLLRRGEKSYTPNA